MTQQTYVLYHANCMDGRGVAYVACKKLGDSENIHYIPVQYNKRMPDMIDGPIVYILDF